MLNLKPLEPINSRLKHQIGTIFNDKEVLDKRDRKNVLLLCDDIRHFSGIATMAQEFVKNSLHRMNWVQIGAGINHPERGKAIDMSQAFEDVMEIENPMMVIYPWDSYGTQDLVRDLIVRHDIDAVLHFTDPRQWGWLYEMGDELRNEYKVPLLYLNIWDNLPDPNWNIPFYSSCDSLMAISKLTYGINYRLLNNAGIQVNEN